jgi:hypothetical protein
LILFFSCAGMEPRASTLPVSYGLTSSSLF